ncbi:hypothetical protein EG850_01355 [Gulosibacter macacae]|uniref:Protein kinase domain-containing protein n=1 Tax=Gulosibacter macacae TaxID=2488791 RepID=A0A3P3W186_9MICO|nr:hypothetical protein [Gulosibacter macacae]RRJ88811.1 hypothetical protein EG850_01355 [Gulosibacter macacae]
MFSRSRGGEPARAPVVGQVISGWRLVRPLGHHGARCEFVGVCEAPVPTRATASDHWREFGAVAEEPLLQRRIVIMPDLGDGALARECTLREQLAADFIERAEEVLSDGEWQLAVYALKPRWSYAELIAEGTQLDAGAAVSLLVPLAETLALAHESGIVHTALTLQCCRIDAHGRPSIEGWDAAIRVDELPAVRRDLLRTDDLRALGRLADAVLANVVDAPSEELARLISALTGSAPPRDAARRLIDELFNWRVPDIIPERTPASLAPTMRVADDQGTASDQLGVETLLGDDGDMSRPVPRGVPGGKLALLQARMIAFASEVNARTWALLAIAGALLAGTGLLLPALTSGSAAAEDTGATSQPTPIATLPERTDGAAPALEPQPTASEPTFTSSASATAIESADQLATARNECLVLADAACLDQVYASGAPGLDADLTAIGAGTAGDRVTTATSWILAADLGDIEILQGSGGIGSLSLERTADGWRIREVWVEHY